MSQCQLCGSDGGTHIKITVCKWCEKSDCVSNMSESACVCPNCASIFCAENVNSILLKILIYSKTSQASGVGK
jgi:hypothetical protein